MNEGGSCPTDPASLGMICGQFLADSTGCWHNNEAQRARLHSLMYLHLTPGEQLDSFLAVLGTHLAQCLNCLAHYVDHRAAVGDLFRGKLRANELSALEDAIEDWDKQRLISNFTSAMGNFSSCHELLLDPPTCRKLSLGLFEMLSCSSPKMLRVYSFKVETFYRHMTGNNCEINVDLTCFTQLLFHPTPEVAQLTQALVEHWPQPLSNDAAAADTILSSLPPSFAQIPRLMAESRARGLHHEMSSLWKSTLSLLKLFTQPTSTKYSDAFPPLVQATVLSLQVDQHSDAYRDRCFALLLVLLQTSYWEGQANELPAELIRRSISLFMAHLGPDLASVESAFKELAKVIEYVVRSCKALAHFSSVADRAIALVLDMQQHAQFAPEVKNKIANLGMQLTEFGFTNSSDLPLMALRAHASLYISLMAAGSRRAKVFVARALQADALLLDSHKDSLQAPLSRPPLLELWSNLCTAELPGRAEVYHLVLASFRCLALVDRVAISHTALANALTGSARHSFGAAIAHLDSLCCDFLGRAAQRLDPAIVQELIELPRGRATLGTLLLGSSGPIRESLMSLLTKAGFENLVGVIQSFSRDSSCRLAEPLEQSCAILVRIIENYPAEAPETLGHFQIVVSLYQDLFNGSTLADDLAELLDSEKSTRFTLSLWRLVKGVLLADAGPHVKALEAAFLSFKRITSSGKSSATLQSLFQAVVEVLPPLVRAVDASNTSDFYCVAAELVEVVLQYKTQLPLDSVGQVESLATALVNKLPETSRATFEFRLKLLLGAPQSSSVPLPTARPTVPVLNDTITINSDSDSDYCDLPFFTIPKLSAPSVQNTSAVPEAPNRSPPPNKGSSFESKSSILPTPSNAGDSFTRVQNSTASAPIATSTPSSYNGAGPGTISVQKMTTPIVHTSSLNPFPVKNVEASPSGFPKPTSSIAPKVCKQVPITLFTTPQPSALPKSSLPSSTPNHKPTEAKTLTSFFAKVHPKPLPSNGGEQLLRPQPRVEAPKSDQGSLKELVTRPPSKGDPSTLLRNESPRLISPVVREPRSRPPSRGPAAVEVRGVEMVEKIIAKATVKPSPIVNKARQGEYPRPVPLKPVLTKKSKKQQELTLATLPHLDPRIPKKANPIIAHSKSKANQLLRRIQVDQSAVKSFNKPTGSSESSSSDDSDSDAGGGLNQFLKKSLPTPSSSKPVTSRPPQPARAVHSAVSPSRDASSDVDIENSSSNSGSDSGSDTGSGSDSDSDASSESGSSRPTPKAPKTKPPPKLSKSMGTLIPIPYIALDNFSFDVDRFDSTVLRWSCEATGDLPVWFNAAKPHCTRFRNIPQSFTSVREYVETLEPLLFLECWAQIQKARQEAFPDDAIACSVVGYQQAQNFFDVTLNSGRGHSQFSENDLLMLTLPHLDDASRFYKVLAKMRRTTAHRGNSAIEVRCCLDRDRNLVLGCLRPNVSASILKLTSMATMHRDYLALHGLGSYHLVNDILEGHASGFDEPNPAKVQQLIERHELNHSQAEAIVASASKKEGFSLIQGPPGTGKTKTILGLVATLRETTRRDPSQGKYWARSQKLLICAPSNAAVDEIVRRLRAELKDPAGSPKLIRVGISESINQVVQDQTLDYLIEANLRTQAAGDFQRAKDEIDKFNAKIDKLRAEIKKTQAMREELREAAPGKESANPRDTERYLALKKKVDEIGDEIDLQFQLRSASSRAMDAARYKVRDRLLNGAEIICCTLSGAGHDMMQNMACDFDTVIIDEAAQSVELASLIPLRFGCRRCIMIGDPHQLPPTVMSLTATKYGYNNSLFSRMFDRNNGTAHLLNVQYRMHPAISQLPSALFYEGRLLDAPGLAESKAAPWHASPLFPPYHFYDVSEGEDTSNRFHSRENTFECEAACGIVRRLCYDFPDIDFKGRIAVISPYKGQISQMKYAFSRKFGGGIYKTIEFNTIDGFQGQEKDIVIFSCVRAGAAADIGFLSDIRRMNVGLTRAQKSLFVIGRAFTLSGDPHWKILVEKAKEQGRFSEINMRQFSVKGHISYDNILYPRPGKPTKDVKEKAPPSNGTGPNQPSSPNFKSPKTPSLAKPVPQRVTEGNPAPKDSKKEIPPAKMKPIVQPDKKEAPSAALRKDPSQIDGDQQTCQSSSLDLYTPNKRPALDSLKGPPPKGAKIEDQKSRPSLPENEDLYEPPKRPLFKASEQKQLPPSASKGSKHDARPSHNHRSSNHRPDEPQQPFGVRDHHMHPQMNHPPPGFDPHSQPPPIFIRGYSTHPHGPPQLDHGPHYPPHPQDLQFDPGYPSGPEFILPPGSHQGYPPGPEFIPPSTHHGYPPGPEFIPPPDAQHGYHQYPHENNGYP